VSQETEKMLVQVEQVSGASDSLSEIAQELQAAAALFKV
jgi:methyl-accepting chemotaxis protein